MFDEMQMLRKGKALPAAKVTPAMLFIATIIRIVTCNLVNQMRTQLGFKQTEQIRCHLFHNG